jgi:hypothetical protein
MMIKESVTINPRPKSSERIFYGHMKTSDIDERREKLDLPYWWNKKKYPAFKCS